MKSSGKKFKISRVIEENGAWKAGAFRIYGDLSFIEQTSKHPHAYFAAYQSGKMAGHAIVLCSDGRWILDGLRVDPKHRERGIGKALTGARIRYAVSKGAKEIWYCCAADNLLSTCCHTRFGFKKVRPASKRESPELSHWYKLDVRDLK
ncbi:MAG: hypothetical protein COT17_01620 [Elusimicrobia bacterium CG08_land_8_20_14_0_20_51_18]|nr:MAG: hypothetical protein COT17_01620 [Elusimicrobia bacterium CG08_land_8_20_14_0_20_51_18]